MTPIERAARAMYETIAPDWDWDDPDAELLRRMYRANAHAALAALKNASDHMRAQGQDHLSAGGEISAQRLWEIMVEAALSEG